MKFLEESKNVQCSAVMALFRGCGHRGQPFLEADFFQRLIDQHRRVCKTSKRIEMVAISTWSISSNTDKI